MWWLLCDLAAGAAIAAGVAGVTAHAAAAGVAAAQYQQDQDKPYDAVGVAAAEEIVKAHSFLTSLDWHLWYLMWVGRNVLRHMMEVFNVRI